MARSLANQFVVCTLQARFIHLHLHLRLMRHSTQVSLFIILFASTPSILGVCATIDLIRCRAKLL